MIMARKRKRPHRRLLDAARKHQDELEAAGSAQTLIKYAINAATVRHLVALCDQLEGELGGADPVQRARAIEEQIVAAAQRAFAGRPELAAFEPKPSP